MLPYLRTPGELVVREANEGEKSALRAQAYPHILDEPLMIISRKVSADQPPASGTNPEKGKVDE